MGTRIAALQVDTGIRKMDIEPTVEFVFITHTHSDHWKNAIIQNFIDVGIPVFSHEGCRLAKGNAKHITKMDKATRKAITYVPSDGEFTFEGMFETYNIKLHPLVHDVPNVGLEIEIVDNATGEITRVAYATDTGNLRRFRPAPCHYNFIETNYCKYVIEFIREQRTQGKFDRYARSYTTHMAKQDTAIWWNKYYQGKIPGAVLIQMHMSNETYKLKNKEIDMEKLMTIKAVEAGKGFTTITFTDQDSGIDFTKNIYATGYDEATKTRVADEEKMTKANEVCEKYFGVDYDSLPLMELGGTITLWVDDNGYLYFEEPGEGFEKKEYTKAPGTSIPFGEGVITAAYIGPRGISVEFKCNDKHRLPIADLDDESLFLYRKQFGFTKRNAAGDFEVNGNLMLKKRGEFIKLMEKCGVDIEVPNFKDFQDKYINMEELIGMHIQVRGDQVPSSKANYWTILDIFEAE